MARTQVPAFDTRDEDDRDRVRPVAEGGLEVEAATAVPEAKRLGAYVCRGEQPAKEAAAADPAALSTPGQPGFP